MPLQRHSDETLDDDQKQVVTESDMQSIGKAQVNKPLSDISVLASPVLGPQIERSKLHVRKSIDHEKVTESLEQWFGEGYDKMKQRP